jgi:selenocysteine lyase/cysteine desulfurase
VENSAIRAEGGKLPSGPLVAPRDDFPIVSDHIFLNSAYIAPAPRPVVDASHAHIRGKSARPVQLNTLMAANEPIRAHFARIVNAAR